MCNLTATEQDILKKGVSVGNQVLYDLCQNYSLSIFCKNYESLSRDKKADTANGLAAQLWLIGRAYAASPERRGYGILKGTKIEYKNSGNGLDDYFDKLAESLTKKLKPDFWDSLDKLRYSEYKFDSLGDDTNTLKNSITAVLELNHLLKQARFEIDKDDLKKHINNHKAYQEKYPNDTVNKAMADFEKNNKNMISFCSKFLHFHFPNTVFIIDSITESHFKGRTEYIFSFKSVDESGNTSFENSKIKITKSAVDEIIDKLDLKEFDSEPERKYVKHCVREYLVAAEINKSHQCVWEGKYIPRVVDTYMLIANSK